MQSNENKTDTRSELKEALQRLAQQSKPNTWRNGVAAVRDTDVRLLLAALAAERDRADRAEAWIEALACEWRVLNSAERDIINGRPVDDALEEQSDSRAAIDRLIAEVTA